MLAPGVWDVGRAGALILAEDGAGARPCRPRWSAWPGVGQGDRSGPVARLGLRFSLVQPVHFAKTAMVSEVNLNLPLTVKKY